MDKYKILTAIVILLSSSIFGFFIYKGITEVESMVVYQNRMEYIGKRRMDCYGILNKERERSATGVTVAVSAEYFEPSGNPYDGKNFNDACRVTYTYMTGSSSYIETTSF